MRPMAAKICALISGEDTGVDCSGAPTEAAIGERRCEQRLNLALTSSTVQTTPLTHSEE
jgi:hypothetical protein